MKMFIIPILVLTLGFCSCSNLEDETLPETSTTIIGTYFIDGGSVRQSIMSEHYPATVEMNGSYIDDKYVVNFIDYNGNPQRFEFDTPCMKTVYIEKNNEVETMLKTYVYSVGVKFDLSAVANLRGIPRG